ncbi:hypothetical protein MCOR14_009226 [Pyricularia oryzae]|uniref:Ecp2 effector protein-like domain-containing protein n=1 Tax=Pyricularia oryzae TaxID=318829 RepID=A0A4P7NBG5_PYROR|nr:hypothetical protein MCOR13_010091 [Pyricularia oryzae]KAI6557017.1 hypothetical protein MCOR04_010208 [Pyricularia oryzae]KAI6624673.1 hypothetical protein MCOR14_009226 [Pyricularia oryzae]QBZ58406.1 hypothetical protein PoMZ_03358 [Pyricularia oryzae]
MVSVKNLLALLAVATTPVLAVLGKVGTTTNHKGNPLGVGKDLCENIGYTGPTGNIYKRPLLEDCKKLLSIAENMGDNEVFRVEDVCENNKNDWELRFSFQTCGLFLRPDTTVVYGNKDRIYWMGKQDVVEILHMVITGNNIREGHVQARGDAFNCLVTDREEYPVSKQYMEFLVDNPDNFDFPFRSPCQDS